MVASTGPALPWLPCLLSDHSHSLLETTSGGIMFGLGAPELLILSFLVLAPLVGVWCMTIFQSKNRSGGAGFVVGFFLTLVLSLVGAAIAAGISYSLSEFNPAPPAA